MLKLRLRNQFKRDYKKAVKRGLNQDDFARVVGMLQAREKLPANCRDHALTNSRDYKNMRDCHISPDWILIYQIVEDELILELVRTGTHSDLF